MTEINFEPTLEVGQRPTTIEQRKSYNKNINQ